MKKSFLLIISILGVSLVAFNCNRKSSATKTSDSSAKTAKLMTLTKNGITLTELYSPEQFSDATIALVSNTTSENLDSNKITLSYTTTNYELGKQTNTTGMKTCANAVKGQHIHCIIDNQPYNAIYDANSTISAKTDGQHIILSFLSRSYHESIKNKNAFTLTSAITGKSRYLARYSKPSLDKPMLFYSRPKGEYTGSETDAVLLDFYLVNCDLSKEGYKVKAEINGNEFVITKWSGYFMEGLPAGENTIKLTLLDKDNNAVDSPYNTSERKFTLKK